MIPLQLIESTRAFLKAAEDFDFKNSRNLNPLLAYLKHIKIREGYVLDYFLCGSGWGGSSRFYVRKADANIRYTPEENYNKTQNSFWSRKEVKLKNPLPAYTDDMFIDGRYPLKVAGIVPDYQNYFTFEFEEAAIWEMNLLKNYLTVYMPKYWHGCYHDAKLVLGDEELLNISYIDCSQYLNNSLIQPSIIVESPDKAMLSETFFSKWGGLTQMRSIVEHKDNKIIFNYPYERTSLIEYHCGICF